MVVIRLARAGKRKNPFYHLSVTDKRNPRDGRFIERVGYYNPIARGEAVRSWVNLERVDYWISVGAIPSPKVKSIIKNARIEQANQVEVATSAEDSSDEDATAADVNEEMVAEQVEGDTTEASAESDAEGSSEETSEESTEEVSEEESTTEPEDQPEENSVANEESGDSPDEESKESSS